MANANTTPAQFQTAGAGYQKDYISDKQRKALMLYAMVVILNQTGGPNYVTNLEQLVKDASVGTSGLQLGDLDVDLPAVWGKWANSLDATNFPATSNAALQKIGTFQTRDPVMFQRIELWLVDLLRQNLV